MGLLKVMASLTLPLLVRECVYTTEPPGKIWLVPFGVKVTLWIVLTVTASWIWSRTPEVGDLDWKYTACVPAAKLAGTVMTAQTSFAVPPFTTPVLLITAPRLAAVQSARLLERNTTVQPAGSVLLVPNVVVEEASRS